MNNWFNIAEKSFQIEVIAMENIQNKLQEEKT